MHILDQNACKFIKSTTFEKIKFAINFLNTYSTYKLNASDFANDFCILNGLSAEVTS
jgi:hypothetical protein